MPSSAKLPLTDEAEPRKRPRTLVATDGLGKYFPVRTGFFSRGDKLLRAVDGVSIRVRRAETVGLVGERPEDVAAFERALTSTYARIASLAPPLAPASRGSASR